MGDILIIAAYVELEERELAGHAPRLIYVDDANREKARRSRIPLQESA